MSANPNPSQNPPDNSAGQTPAENQGQAAGSAGPNLDWLDDWKTSVDSSLSTLGGRVDAIGSEVKDGFAWLKTNPWTPPAQTPSESPPPSPEGQSSQSGTSEQIQVEVETPPANLPNRQRRQNSVDLGAVARKMFGL